jgi:hypothetical protein
MGLDQNFIDEWGPKAQGVTYLGTPLSKMNRDELLAVCGWVAHHTGELERIADEFKSLVR